MILKKEDFYIVIPIELSKPIEQSISFYKYHLKILLQ